MSLEDDTQVYQIVEPRWNKQDVLVMHWSGQLLRWETAQSHFVAQITNNA